MVRVYKYGYDRASALMSILDDVGKKWLEKEKLIKEKQKDKKAKIKSKNILNNKENNDVK